MASKQKAPEVEYTKPTSQLDLEARLDKDNRNEAAEAPLATYPDAQDEEGFVGVSPEYANYANDTDKPLAAEEGAEKVAEDLFLDEVAKSAEFDPASTPDTTRQSDSDSEDKSDDEQPADDTTPTGENQ